MTPPVFATYSEAAPIAPKGGLGEKRDLVVSG